MSASIRLKRMVSFSFQFSCLAFDAFCFAFHASCWVAKALNRTGSRWSSSPRCWERTASRHGGLAPWACRKSSRV